MKTLRQQVMEAHQRIKEGAPIGNQNARKDYSGAVEEFQSGIYGSQIGGYTTINTYLRSGRLTATAEKNGVTTEKIDRYVKDIDGAIDEAPLDADKTLYRGVRHSDEIVGKNVKVGDTFTDKGFQSTSASRSKASQFAEKLNRGESPTVLKISLRKGDKALNVSKFTGIKAGLGGEEKEFLLPRGTTFKVTGIRKGEISVRKV